MVWFWVLYTIVRILRFPCRSHLTCARTCQAVSCNCDAKYLPLRLRVTELPLTLAAITRILHEREFSHCRLNRSFLATVLRSMTQCEASAANIARFCRCTRLSVSTRKVKINTHFVVLLPVVCVSVHFHGRHLDSVPAYPSWLYSCDLNSCRFLHHLFSRLLVRIRCLRLQPQILH
jgi:hypothetical protein